MATTPRPLADYFAELRDPRVHRTFWPANAVSLYTSRPHPHRTSIGGATAAGTGGVAAVPAGGAFGSAGDRGGCDPTASSTGT